jgi:ribose transport system permease protein
MNNVTTTASSPEVNAPGDPTSVTSSTAPRSSMRWREAPSNYAVVGFLIALIVGFSIAMPSRFATSGNIGAILGDQAIPGMLALAVLLPLAGGEFDLSVAANLGFASVLSARLAGAHHSLVFIFVACLLLGLLIGAVNALFVVGFKVNAFVATLGMSTILSGGNLAVTNGQTLYSGVTKSFTNLATHEVFGVQVVFVWFVVLVAVTWVALEHTRYGRYLRATGLGREAARLSGVKTSQYMVSAFVVAGLIAGICGFLQTARFGSATATVGPSFLLPAYAAAFIGATTIRRGVFNVWGTIVGLFLVAVGINGITLAGAPFWVPDVFNGAALMIAVALSGLVFSKTRKKG